MNARTIPNTPELRTEAEEKLYTQLSKDEGLSPLKETLSEELDTQVELENISLGSIRVDMVLSDLSKLEYLKHLSDKAVLTNIVDHLLMTPEFISSCQAKDVALEAVVEEESYKRLHSGKYQIKYTSSKNHVDIATPA